MFKTAGELLTSKARDAVWIDPLAAAFDAVELMNKEKIGALLVQIDGYLVGIVTERDYITNVVLSHKVSKTTKISEIMVRNVVTVDPESSIEECLDLLKQHNIRHLPVMIEGRPVGILSLRDLFLAHLERPVRAVS